MGAPESELGVAWHCLGTQFELHRYPIGATRTLVLPSGVALVFERRSTRIALHPCDVGAALVLDWDWHCIDTDAAPVSYSYTATGIASAALVQDQCRASAA